MTPTRTSSLPMKLFGGYTGCRATIIVRQRKAWNSILATIVAAPCKHLLVGLEHHAFMVRILDEVVKRSDSFDSGRDLGLKLTWVLVAILGIGSSQGMCVRYEYLLP